MALNVFCRRMMKFNRFNCPNFIISNRKFSETGDVLLVEKLKERTLLRLNGQNANEYLQGLMTNDMNHFNSGASSIYAMFLNNKGRLLYDSIIYKTSSDNTYLIECDINAALPLLDHLNHYKVRRKINIDISDEYDIWAVSKNNHKQNLDDVPDYKNLVNAIKEKLPEMFSTIDPRLQSMGLRIVSQKDVNLSENLEKILNVKTRVENFYKLLRYRLGIGEGMNELLFGKSFPLEINGDYMHGISFHKGCYIGQELTARTYHIGEIRKRIMPIKFNDKVSKFEHGASICTSDPSNKAIGKLYGAEETNGIALLRIEEALKGNQMIISNKKCETHRPFWWPIEAPKTRMKSG